MQALILAAGRGTRLESETDNKPKCLTKVQGKPLIDWQIDALRGAGIDKINAATGYKSEMLASYVSQCFFNPQWHSSNMVSSLLRAESLWTSEDIIVSYSDIIYSSRTVSKLIEAKHDITIMYDLNWLKQWQLRFDNPLDDAETFKLDNNNRLIEIGAKTDDLASIQGQYTGLFKLSKKGFKTLKTVVDSLPEQDQANLDMTALFALLLNKGITINCVSLEGFWFEIDNQKDRKICEELLDA